MLTLGLFIFVINGFPYGGFHHTRVKDQVHAPDWTTQDRVLYTIQLFNILAELLPEGMDGGVSTSPLSYKYWHPELIKEERAGAMAQATNQRIAGLELSCSIVVCGGVRC